MADVMETSMAKEQQQMEDAERPERPAANLPGQQNPLPAMTDDQAAASPPATAAPEAEAAASALAEPGADPLNTPASAAPAVAAESPAAAKEAVSRFGRSSRAAALARTGGKFVPKPKAAKSAGDQPPPESEPPAVAEPAPAGLAPSETVALKQSELVSPSPVARQAQKQLQNRKQVLHEQKVRINADLQRTARNIMLGGFVATVGAVIGLWMMVQGGLGAKVGWVILGVAMVAFGALGMFIFRLYATGKRAIDQRQQRQQSERARQFMHQFGAKLSVETRQSLLEVDARVATPKGQEVEAMHLKLKDDELSNALQFLCMTSREGELTLAFPNGRSGQLFLAEGSVTFAKFGDTTGLEAVARLLKEGAAEASFFEGRDGPPPNLDMPISSLLINATVMGDELG